MGLLKTIGKGMISAGEVNGSKFPLGTIINFGKDKESNDRYIMFTYPDNTEEKITHDMVQCATVLAMGVVKVQNGAPVHGTKYLCVLKDGRQAVLTVEFGYGQVENVLF